MQCFEDCRARSCTRACGAASSSAGICFATISLMGSESVVGDHVENDAQLPPRLLAGLDTWIQPTFGVRCGEHFRKNRQRECERATLPPRVVRCANGSKS